MNMDRLIARLSAFPGVVSALFAPIPEEEVRWRPPEGGWSLLEILCHLADEEAEDFRTRMAYTLEDPEREWPAIDPEGDILRRGYNERDPWETLARFDAARIETVTWLRGLDAPDWGRRHRGPAGTLAAGDILASLVAHDALHLRQIARRLYDLGVRDSAGFSAEYAGGW